MKPDIDWQLETLVLELQTARRDTGVTQAELANRLGKPRVWVVQCETGRRRIDLLELRRICEALGISFADFALKVDNALKQR